MTRNRNTNIKGKPYENTLANAFRTLFARLDR